MTTFDVHLYCTVRVKVAGVQAPSMKDAIEQAEDQLPLSELFDRDIGELHPNLHGATIVYAEADPNDIHTAMVDVQGDEDYAKTRIWKCAGGLWVLDDRPEDTDTPTSLPDAGDSTTNKGEA